MSSRVGHVMPKIDDDPCWLKKWKEVTRNFGEAAAVPAVLGELFRGAHKSSSSMGFPSWPPLHRRARESRGCVWSGGEEWRRCAVRAWPPRNTSNRRKPLYRVYQAVTLIGGVCAGIEPWPVFFCIPEHCSRAGAGGLAAPQEFEEREIHVTHRRVSHDKNVLARLQWAMVFCHPRTGRGTVCDVRVCDAPVAVA
eukprot:scaffold20530_cov68-Phaeocystis_antarctica.AAC.8